MVELGNLHDTHHFTLGEKASTIVDYVLVVMPNRISSFIRGFQQYATKEQILLTFNTFSEAKKWLHTNAKSTDVILLENDLPDLYETNIIF
jgi:hypothetical protein